ncbi:peptidoglycan-binding domain-containing protein [Georgenia yuyongxinii]|uniref:peptidoglycan-binding domain-containing protein n=1 Tax=Georgenia yuyongxinii TaxID=2589797 RepID=UPI00163DDB66|nr:peptidoglycan-binding domain-containing protein [Georgenia yuyongxinii]
MKPPSATTVAATRLVPAPERTFDDSHTVAAAPVLAEEVTVLTSGAGGMVTATSCTSGTEVKSGDHLLSVNGVPRIAVVTDVPLWRDLDSGSKGADVEAIQRALAAQGYGAEVSGTYNWSTKAAVIKLQKDASVATTGKIALDAVQWVPADPGQVSSCEVGVGTLIGAGQPMLKVGGGLVELLLPSSMAVLPGRSYVAVAGDIVVPIPKDRRLTGGALLSAVAASHSYAEWKRDPANGVSVEIRLAEPVAAVGVPPSAVVLADGDNGCVVTEDDVVVAVEILASELGTVFVVPDQLVEAVVIPAVEVISACA